MQALLNDTNLLTLIGIIVALFIGIWQIWVAYYPIFMAKKTKKQIKNTFGNDIFEEVQILDAIQYYIEPDCSQVDPTTEEDIRQVAVVRERVFHTVDRFLLSSRAEKHLLILADSGMGKTSFLLNYYDRNRRKRKNNRQRIAIIPLGRPGAIDKIMRIDQKRDITLFLDAFDEDTEAIYDHHHRLQMIMEACADFRRIVITCRTQFFRSDEEIPKETGVAIVAPRKAGESREYKFYKLYLLPLTDKQVSRYVRRRFPFWQRGHRKAARKIISMIPEMSIRPMLLVVIPDLIREKRFITEIFHLYEFMVENWLEREKSWIDKDRLREFSELLAVDLFINRHKRGFERIPRQELLDLKDIKASDLDSWKLTTRSLLNRDSEGNYKFSHRSIMEYLFIVALLKGENKCLKVEWTDLMKQLFVSWGRTEGELGRKIAFKMFQDADFRMTRLFPIKITRNQPAFLIKESALTTISERFELTTYIQLPIQWQNIFVRKIRSGDTLLVFNLSVDLVWFLAEFHLSNDGEKESTYRIRFEERKEMLENLREQKWLGRRTWREPTLDEFDTLFAVDMSFQKQKKY